MNKKYIAIVLLMFVLVLTAAALTGCGNNVRQDGISSSESENTETSVFTSEEPQTTDTVINIFVPSSMVLAMNDIIDAYRQSGKAGNVVANYSDTQSLSQQLRDGADCDIFISDDPAVMDELEREGILKADTRSLFSGYEAARITPSEEGGQHTETEEKAVSQFYDFLLSDEALSVVEESLDDVADGQQ